MMDSQKTQNIESSPPQPPPAPIISDFGNKNNFFSQPPPNLSHNNFNNVNTPPYMNYIQQYAQNRMQQQMENNSGGFNNFRPPPHFNQAPSPLFNKPIRFNINKQGTKVNPMMRQQQSQHQMQMQFNNNSTYQMQNANAKKRKNKKKNKNKGGNNDGFNLANPFPIAQPPLPPTFNHPPPPIQPPLPPQSSSSSSSSLEKSDSTSNSTESNNASANGNLNDIPSPASSSTASGSSNNPAMEWPESLYNYVARCYMKCQTPLDKDLCEITLKGKITMAANRNELFTKDWDNEPMPILHSERQQQQQQQSPVSNIFNKNKPVVTGHLAQYQNLAAKKNTQSPLIARKSPLRKRRTLSRSRSRSRSGSPVKRRRSSDEDDKYTSSQVKLTKASKKKLKKEKNSAFYSKYGASGIGGGLDSVDSERLKKRADRFNKSSAKVQSSSSTTNSLSLKKRLSMPSAFNSIVDDCEDMEDFLNLHIVGTCRDLEKSFLRLTKAPDASEVRPVEVLIYSLQNVKDKWIEKQDYFYACDQLKSIRQDLTVQGIRDNFTIKVYETHAR